MGICQLLLCIASRALNDIPYELEKRREIDRKKESKRKVDGYREIEKRRWRDREAFRYICVYTNAIHMYNCMQHSY